MSRVALALVFVLFSLPVAGQPPSAFEVASVKPNAATDARGMMGPQAGGRFVMVNGTATSLITFAYSLTSDDAIVGLPNWVRGARFDVNAKATESNVPFDRLRLMVQTLLTERFKLTAHADIQEQPTYALVLARTDRRLGPRLRPAKVNCDELTAQIAAGKATLTPPAPTGPVPPCVMRNRPGTFHSGGTTMKVAATVLYPAVQRVIIDRTGLDGYFELELDYEPPQSAPNAEPSQLPSINDVGGDRNRGSSQLCLKAEPLQGRKRSRSRVYLDDETVGDRKNNESSMVAAHDIRWATAMPRPPKAESLKPRA